MVSALPALSFYFRATKKVEAPKKAPTSVYKSLIFI